MVLSETLDENAVQTLLDLSIANKFPKQCDEWHSAKKNISDFYFREWTKKEQTAFEELATKEHEMRRVLYDALVGEVMALFPSLEGDGLSSSHLQTRGDSNDVDNSMQLSDLKASYPDFQEIYRSHFQAAKFDTISRRDTDFEARKLRLVSVQYLLEKHPRLRPERRTQLVQSLLRGDFDNAQSILHAQESKRLSSVFTLVTAPLSVFLTSPSDGGSLKREVKSHAARISDSQFLLEMKGVDDEVLRPMIHEIDLLSHSLLSSIIDTTAGTMAHEVVAMQHEVFRRNLKHEIESGEWRQRSKTLVAFIRKLNTLSAGRRDCQCIVHIDGVATTPFEGRGDFSAGNSRYPYHSQEYWITGCRNTLKDQELEFRVRLINLSSDDKHKMQLDTKYIPGPMVNNLVSSRFHMPMTMDIAFCQILENEKLLLILADRERPTDQKT
jgi:hypothetical protein